MFSNDILDGYILFFIEMIRRVIEVGKKSKKKCFDVTIVAIIFRKL